MGLCGLAAVALCPDLADLKFTRSQITEHRLHCPWLLLLGPPLPSSNTTFLLLDNTTRNVLMMNGEPRECKQRQRWSVPSEIRRRSENALNFFPLTLDPLVTSTWSIGSFLRRVYLQTYSPTDMLIEARSLCLLSKVAFVTD